MESCLSLHPNGFSSPVVQVLIQLLSSPAELWEVRTKSYLGKLPCRQTAHWDFVSTTSQPRVSPAWSKGAALHDRVNKAKSQAWWRGGRRTVFSSDSVPPNPWLPSGLVQAFVRMSLFKCCCSMVLWLEFCEEENFVCSVAFVEHEHLLVAGCFSASSYFPSNNKNWSPSCWNLLKCILSTFGYFSF